MTQTTATQTVALQEPPAEEIRFLKPPLDNAADWPDVPPNLEGRVVLKRWPVDEFSEGGVILPDRGEKRVMGVAWVVRAIGDEVEKYLQPGDSVIVPEYAIDSGLLYPGEPNADIVSIDASSVYHRLPYAVAMKHFKTACLVAESELKEAAPKIQALTSGGDFVGARAWCGRLAAKTDRLSDESRKTLAGLAMQVDTEQRAREAAEAAEKERARRMAKEKLDAEREERRLAREAVQDAEQLRRHQGARSKLIHKKAKRKRPRS